MRVIINADDFGLNESCTKAIKKSFELGIITDTTMIANGQAFDLAVDLGKSTLIGRVGIHLNLTEGIPLTQEILLCERFVKEGVFHGKINRNKPLTKKEKQAVYKELTAQVVKIKDAGIDITHADSHHHIHNAIFISPIFLRVCKEQGIKKIRAHRTIGDMNPLKRLIKRFYNLHFRNKGFITPKYFGSVQDVKSTGFLDCLEIMVHPDFNGEGEIIDKVYDETGKPCGDCFYNLIQDENIRLIGYRDL